MKKISSPQLICLGGLFTALAVIFHSAPVFMPGLGLVLSPFATLPIALAAIFSSLLGITTLLSSALILIFISPQEAIILLLTTGALGLALGLGFRKGFWAGLLTASVTLFLGISTLTYAIGIPAFGSITSGIPFTTVLLIYLLFSLAYSSVWVLITRFFAGLFKKAKLFESVNNQQSRKKA